MIGNDKIRLSYRQLIMRNNLISFFTQRLLFHGQQFCLTPRITPRTQGFIHAISHIIIRHRTPEIRT